MSEERKKHISHLKAMLRCCERVSSGTGNCGDDCDNCELQYAKGNMGEIKDTLAYAISSLETDEAYNLMYEQPEFCEDCISRKYLKQDMIKYGWKHPDSTITEYVESLPSVLPKATKNNLEVDCISRDEVCRYVAEFVNHEFSTREEEELIDNIITGIEHLPSVTPQTRKGHWIKSRDCYGNNHYTCPFCEHDIATKYDGTWKDNYCSNCGAKMVEPQESEEE